MVDGLHLLVPLHHFVAYHLPRDVQGLPSGYGRYPLEDPHHAFG